MEKLERFLETRLMPIAVKLAGQRHLAAVRDSFIGFMPLLVIGSLFIIIQNFPVAGWEEAQVRLFGDEFPQLILIPKRVTFDLMAFYISMLVAYKLAQSYKIDPVSAAMLSMVSFITITPIKTTVEINGTMQTIDKIIPLGGWFGTNGILIALATGIVVVEIFHWFIKKNIVIKMPEGVPPAVSKAFSALLPGFIIIVFMLLVKVGFETTSYENIHNFVYKIIGYPVQTLIVNNVFGAIGTVFVTSLLWSIGLNGGAIVGGILRAFWMPLQEQNFAANKAGLIPPNIVTEQFFDLIWIGGVGATLIVVIIMMFRAKSMQYRELAKVSLPPGIFNINEPIMFGMPIVLNLIGIIPLILAPIAITIVNYYAMDFNIVHRTIGVYLPWSTPPLIQGFLITGHISGAILQLVDMIIVGLIWWPFIKIMDKRKYQEELEIEKKSM
jgi:PTS system cellobiose-specific IIC component